MLMLVIAAARLVADALAQLFVLSGMPSDAILVVAGVSDWSEFRGELPAVALVEFPPVVEGVQALLAASVSVALVWEAGDAEAARALGRPRPAARTGAGLRRQPDPAERWGSGWATRTARAPAIGT